MTRILALAAVAVGLLSLASAAAVAQDDAAVLDDLYGRGVHAYYSRDSRTAVELLSEAIANGSQDPRAFYYRGIALRTLGREEDAKLDFQEGAKFEQSGDYSTDVISKSLERVQGAVRLDLESHRRIARLKTRNDRLAREKARYEEIESGDERVLRRPATGRPATRPPAVLPALPADPGDPFGADDPDDPATPPADPTDPVEEPPLPLEPAVGEEPPPRPIPPKPIDDPFGDEPLEAPGDEPAPRPKPAVPADTDPDPFGDDADAGPAEEMPEEDNAAAAVPPASKPGNASRSLFGALGRAILGGDEDKPAAAKPAIDTTDAKDPFADDEDFAPAPAKPAPVVKPAAEPKEEPEDPFAE